MHGSNVTVTDTGQMEGVEEGVYDHVRPITEVSVRYVGVGQKRNWAVIATDRTTSEELEELVTMVLDAERRMKEAAELK